jgi:hypothetical protein
MQDLPTPADLLEAVATFLRERVVPATGGSLSFHARVAANALDIVRREQHLAPDAIFREMTGLRALLGSDAPADLPGANRLLCERIATGRMDLGTPGLAAHLRQTTHDKLAIDQPGYADSNGDQT